MTIKSKYDKGAVFWQICMDEGARWFVNPDPFVVKRISYMDEMIDYTIYTLNDLYIDVIHENMVGVTYFTSYEDAVAHIAKLPKEERRMPEYLVGTKMWRIVFDGEWRMQPEPYVVSGFSTVAGEICYEMKMERRDLIPESMIDMVYFPSEEDAKAEVEKYKASRKDGK